MSDLKERKKCLTNVLSTISVSVHEEMNNLFHILLDTDKNVEVHDHAYNVIKNYIDNIDYANDFQKLGGFQVLLPGLNSEHFFIRCKTAKLIATLVRHNPYCQDKFIDESSYVHMLINLVETDPVNEVQIKALCALSNLVCDNVSVFWKFIHLGGNNLIITTLNSSCDKLKVKTAFLIYSTSNMGNDVADMYVENGVVEILCQIILNMEKSLDENYHQFILSSLNQLFLMSPVKVKEICSNMQNLNQVLCELQDSYSDGTTYQDEKDQILWLMETLTL